MHKLIFLRQASCCSMYEGSVGYGLGWVDENRPMDNSGLTVDTARSLVWALVNSRLDYCNALFATLPAGQMSRLQSVLWVAARLVLQLPRGAAVSSAMRISLHWLNFPQRVTYKLCLLTYENVFMVWHRTT